MSIGSVLDLLRPEFPDVTISKIRFLESEDWLPRRVARREYRRFSAYDAERLRFILTAQRDHYLPLKVIKEQLDAQPDGRCPTWRVSRVDRDYLPSPMETTPTVLPVKDFRPPGPPG